MQYDYKIMILYLFVILIFIVKSQKMQIKDWEFRIVSNNTWHKANVPSTVHLDLLDNKLIQDPYYRDNLLKTYWIQLEDVEYRTTFNVNSSIKNSNYKYLVFEGLDTHCDITLNNKLIYHANNMFRKWKIPIQSFEDTNSLSVYFYSNAKYDLAKEQQLKNNTGIVLPANYSHTRKAAYQYGWDWGPRLLTVGIWKQVYLQAYNQAYLDNVYLRNSPVDSKSTNSTIFIQANLLHLNPNKTYSIGIEFKGQKIYNTTYQIPKFTTNITAKTSLLVTELNLWWTNDVGTPYLYDVKVNLIQNSIVLATKQLKYGVRTINVAQNKDAKGTSFTVVLNGLQLFMRGGNYIPPDMFMPRALKNPQVYKKTIQAALFGRYNMIRVWGGGQFQHDIFYDLCDQKGLLIWHDLMFACAMYPGQADMLENIKNQMIDNLIRLRNHPSIAIWNGNNQVWIGWLEWGWKKGKTTQQLNLLQTWYNDIFRVTLANTIKDYDQDKFYWQTSPSSSSNQVSTINSGDIHFWRVWGGGTNIQEYTQFIGRFNSEYGMQSMLQYSSIVKFTEISDRQITSLVMRIHQRHIYGDKYLPMYTENYAGSSSDLERYAYLSQIMQSYALQTAINSLRGAKPFCMGSLYWQLNDVWPVASWATVDFYGQYKASQYLVRNAYNKFYTTIVYSKNTSTYNFNVINDDIKSVLGTFRYTILDFNGNILKPTKEKGFLIAPGLNFVADSISQAQLSNYVKNKSFSLIALQFQTSTEIIKNNFYFNKPVSLNANLPTITLQWLSDTKLSVKSDTLARYVYIYLKNYESLLLQNNFFDILPNSEVVLQIPPGIDRQSIMFKEYFTERAKNNHVQVIQ